MKYKTSGWFERVGSFVREDVVVSGKVKKKKITEEDLDRAASYVALRLNSMLDGHHKRTVTAAYKKGYQEGFLEGVRDAVKELLAR